MTISELIRRLENVKFRNPNATVVIVEYTNEGLGTNISPIRFGELQDGHLTHTDIDPLANEMRPLQTLVLYGTHTAQELGL